MFTIFYMYDHNYLNKSIIYINTYKYYKYIIPVINLSPFLLNEQFVNGNTCAFNVLNNLKSCYFFYSIFNINSIIIYHI